MKSSEKNEISKNARSLKDRGDYSSSSGSNSTQFYKEDRSKKYIKISKKEYFTGKESLTDSDSFSCDRKVRNYTEKGLLERSFIKNLDSLLVDPEWSRGCPENIGWDVVDLLEYMISDPNIIDFERFEKSLEYLVLVSSNGFKIEYLNQISNILDFASEKYKVGNINKILSKLLKNVKQSIIIKKESDIEKYFHDIRQYFCVLGCLLLTLPNDNDFDILHEALVWQLSASDKLRGEASVRKRCIIATATPVLVQSVARMIAYSSSHKYYAFVQIALIISCHSLENCKHLLNENIIEYIFYRYNPYFPQWDLPIYNKGPINPDDPNIQLGDSTKHSRVVLSLLLLLLKCAIEIKDTAFPVPDAYSIRCFAWAYRYECRANHRHRRIVMTVLCSALLHYYGQRLPALGEELMAEILSLSVYTEIPQHPECLRGVIFTTGCEDVHFKKILLYLSVDFLKKFTLNMFMLESQHWLLGIMYLLDPVLSELRQDWSPELFKEIHKAAIQALTCILNIVPFKLIREYKIIRRLMWYIEWFSQEPYDMKILYWTLRVLHSVIYNKKSLKNQNVLNDLFDTHGVIILTSLSHTLINNSFNEKNQSILSLILRLLTSAVKMSTKVSCEVYPYLEWPACISALGNKLLDIAVAALENGRIVHDRFLISMLNFIWDAIVWNEKYRKNLISQNGIYKLLDLIAMTNDCVQCIAMAVLCDIVTASQAVSELITWRAKFQASNISSWVSRGCTITSLLASIFREECRLSGIKLDSNNIIQDDENPLMTLETRKLLNRHYPREITSKETPVCLAAADIYGSRLSKVFVILHILTEDLEFKVQIADETYNLYKNIELSCEDEVTLVLCLHYLTAKLNETWSECAYFIEELLPEDAAILTEFLDLGKAWAKEIKNIQEKTLERHISKEKKEELLLYNFLRRARLCSALEALKDIRCIARTTDRNILNHQLIYHAVKAHLHRHHYTENTKKHVIRTYIPSLDD